MMAPARCDPNPQRPPTTNSNVVLLIIGGNRHDPETHLPAESNALNKHPKISTAPKAAGPNPKS